LLGTDFSESDLGCFTGDCRDTGFDLVTFADNSGTIGSLVLGAIGAAFEYGTVALIPLPAALPLSSPVLVWWALLAGGDGERALPHRPLLDFSAAWPSERVDSLSHPSPVFWRSLPVGFGSSFPPRPKN
jgi:hypothetical protein